MEVGLCIRAGGTRRASALAAAQVCSPSRAWEGLIDMIVCAHSLATPAAGHTQWADCARSCQMTAARGCPSQPKYVTADHGRTHARTHARKQLRAHCDATVMRKKGRVKRRMFHDNGDLFCLCCCCLIVISGKRCKEFVGLLFYL